MVQPRSLMWPQRWKLYAGFAVLALGGVGMFFDAWVATAFSLSRYMRTLFGTLLGIIAFAWLALSLRCSQCGLRLFGTQYHLRRWVVGLRGYSPLRSARAVAIDMRDMSSNFSCSGRHIGGVAADARR
jgi:hypothetical protein